MWIMEIAMKNMREKMNRGYWGGEMPTCYGVFAVANILLTSNIPEKLRCVLSI